MKEPNLNIKTVPIDSLDYDPFNVREHDERNVEAIKASLARFGQQKPIVAKKDGTVIAGNGTLGAMRLLGYKEVIIAETELDGEQAVAFSIADNRTSELASWDSAKLASQLDMLSEDKELLASSGFNAQDLAGMAGMDLLEDALSDLEEQPSETEKKYVVVVDFNSGDYDKAKALWDYHVSKSESPHEALLEILR